MVLELSPRGTAWRVSPLKSLGCENRTKWPSHGAYSSLAPKELLQREYESRFDMRTTGWAAPGLGMKALLRGAPAHFVLCTHTVPFGCGQSLPSLSPEGPSLCLSAGTLFARVPELMVPQ